MKQFSSLDLHFPVYDTPQCHFYSHLYLVNERYYFIFQCVIRDIWGMPWISRLFPWLYWSKLFIWASLCDNLCSKFKTLLFNNLVSSFGASFPPLLWHQIHIKINLVFVFQIEFVKGQRPFSMSKMWKVQEEVQGCCKHPNRARGQSPWKLCPLPHRNFWEQWICFLSMSLVI